jgi:ABC-type nitrate/sulfonate/bicarbonate transport system substrate-binding protein
MRKLLVLVLMAVMVANLSAAGTREGPAELPVLRVAVLPFYFCTPAYYVAEKGLDVANGFKIKFETYPMGGPLLEALPANEWDLAFIGTAGVFGIANQGIMPISQILYAAAGSGAFVRPDSAIAKVKGQIAPDVHGNAQTLKGSKVLVPLGSLDHFTVALWMQRAGLGSNDYQVVHMDTNATSYQAFQSGSGDITSLSPPIYTQAMKDGYVMAADMQRLGVEYIDCIYANPATYEKLKQTTATFVRLVAEAQDMFFADKKLAAEWGTKYLRANGINTTEETVMIEVLQRPFVTSAELKTRTNATIARALRNVCEFYISIGRLNATAINNFDNPKVVNTDIIKMAFSN